MYFLSHSESAEQTTFSAEFIHWIAESKCPFQIINDRAFQSLMKTGRPKYSIPSVETL